MNLALLNLNFGMLCTYAIIRQQITRAGITSSFVTYTLVYRRAFKTFRHNVVINPNNYALLEFFLLTFLFNV